MDSLELRLLGPPLIRWGKDVLTPGPKAASLLAFLAVEGRASRERVMTFLWPDSTQKKAQGSLRYLLHSLKKLTDKLVNSDANSLELSAATRVDLSQLNSAQTPEERASAARLHRGVFCEGVSASSAEFEDWLGKQREHWSTTVLENLLHLSKSLEPKEALKIARQAVLLDPASEKAHQTLIRLLMEQGDVAEAHRQLEKCREDLERELGVEPKSETEALLELELEPQSSLPEARSSLFGREGCLHSVLAELDSNRLVTLTGEGGIGKTTLALEAGRRKTEKLQVWLWELSQLRDAECLEKELRKATCVPENKELYSHLTESPALLLVDNCEHLIDKIASCLDKLLQACPGLKILATSREALRIRGERVIPLDPLAVPGESDARPQDFAAVKLFLARVEQTGASPPTDLEAVAKLCRHLDGLPLAVELAAARCRTFSPHKLLQALEQRFRVFRNTSRDAEPRQSTLETLIAWSYDRLPPDEAQLFRQLAIFRSGFQIEAAVEVLGLDEWELMELLDSLVAKSLIRSKAQGIGLRYYFLETIREFAWKSLAEDELRPLQERHLDYFLTLAHNICPLTRGAQQQVWLDQLEAEREDFRAALHFSQEAKPEKALELAAALCPLWKDRDHREEGLEFLERSLKDNPETEPEWPRALLLKGELQIQLARCEEAVMSLTKSLELGRAGQDPRIMARASKGLGNAHFFLSQMERSQVCFEMALQGFRGIQDEHEIANCINNLGLVALYCGETMKAQGLFQESLEAQTEDGNCKGMGIAVGNLGYVATAEGEPERALGYFHESLSLLSKVGALWNAAYFLEGLGKTFGACGLTEGAVECLAVADALRTRLSTPLLPFERDAYAQFVAGLRTELGPAFESLWGEASKKEARAFVQELLESPVFDK